MTQTQAKLPRRVVTIFEGVSTAVLVQAPVLIAGIILLIVYPIDQQRGVFRLQVIPCGRLDAQSHAEWRLFEGTHDSTYLDVDTRTRDATLVGQYGAANLMVFVVQQILLILAVTLVVHESEAQCGTQKQAVVDVAADVDVGIIDIAAVATVEAVVIALEEYVVEIDALGVVVWRRRHIGCRHVDVVPHQAVGVHIIPLCVLPSQLVAGLVAPAIHHHILVLFQVIATRIVVAHHTLSVSQFTERSTVQRVGSRENLVKVPTLMEVDGEVDVRTAVALVERVYETYLVEAQIGLVDMVEAADSLLTDHPKRTTHMTMAEEADTGRIGVDGRHVGTQSVECATHTHIAGCSVEIAAQKACVLVGILCSHWQHGQRKNCKRNNLFHMVINYNDPFAIINFSIIYVRHVRHRLQSHLRHGCCP